MGTRSIKEQIIADREDLQRQVDRINQIRAKIKADEEKIRRKEWNFLRKALKSLDIVNNIETVIGAVLLVQKDNRMQEAFEAGKEYGEHIR